MGLLATRYSLNSQKGFTLIELLTTIAIIGILSSLVFVNLNTGKKQQDIRRAAQKLMLDIRKAQNLSLSPLDPAPCVYGLKINSPADYFLYRNQDCVVSGYTYNNASSVKDPNIIFENGIVANFSDNQDVSFQAPEPITYINGATNASLVITLSNSSCPACTSKNVVINRFGQVEIQ